MNQILTVIPFCTNDGILAERLCDFIYLVNRRVPKGHALLVVSNDTHAEMIGRVRIAAEVAFEHVEVVNSPALVDPNKNVHVNQMFRTAATHIAKTYRVPWLWLEPDAVPLKAGWLETIAEAHYDQPKRYSGSWLMGKSLFLARVSVYPPDAINDFIAGNSPFNMMNGEFVIPKSTKTRLVQEGALTDAHFKPNPDAVLLHHDKNGILMESLRESFEQAALKPAKKK